MRERWATYFEKLLNSNNPSLAQEPIRYETENENENENKNEIEAQNTINPPSINEIEAVIKRLKNNKAPGADEIPAELLKTGCFGVVRAIHGIMLRIWEQEDLPEEWRRSIICPIYKKGDRLRCENYRGISLLCTAYKILAKILKSRIKSHMERITGEYQGGFRAGRLTKYSR